MRLIGIILLPILMVLEYSLAIIAIKMYVKGYGNHIVFRNSDGDVLYKEVESLKVYNVRHLILTLIITVLVGNYARILPKSFDTLFLFAIGNFVIPYSILVANHLTNLRTYHFVLRHPKEIEGEVFLSALYWSKLSQNNLFPFIFILGFMYLFTYSDFILGGLYGTLILIVYRELTKKRYIGNKTIK